jgi:TIR domain
MPLFNERNLRELAQEESRLVRKSVDTLLTENFKSFGVEKTYDIFLSHSYQDKELIYGLKLQLGKLGFSVYIDWDDDAQLDRTHVTPATASMLKERMKACRSLLYALSDKSQGSIWMPWELGYFDGIKGKVAILPISTEKTKNDFVGQEYLGLYYYVDIAQIKGSEETGLWLRETSKKYILFRNWLEKGQLPVMR